MWRGKERIPMQLVGNRLRYSIHDNRDTVMAFAAQHGRTPLWSEEQEWEPATQTFLLPCPPDGEVAKPPPPTPLAARTEERAEVFDPIAALIRENAALRDRVDALAAKLANHSPGALPPSSPVPVVCMACGQW